MPAGQGKDAERFAAAVESGRPLVSADDAELARDLEIVAMLRSRGTAYTPDSDSKARAKQRLMAVLAEQEAQGAVPDQASRRGAPRPTETELTAPLGRLAEPASPTREDEDADSTAETTLMAPVTQRLQPVSDAGSGTDEDAEAEPSSEADETAGSAETTVAPAQNRPSRASRRARHRVANRPAGGPRSGRRPVTPGLRRRALIVGSAAMVMMLAIAGGGIFASRNALPGENLYSVKQVTESAGLALAFDDASRARRQLAHAATRLSEVERLAAHDAQSAPEPQVINETMDEFRTATGEGSELLLEASDDPAADKAAASDLQDWATEQSERLSELRAELPAAADADEAAELLDRLTGDGADADGEECAEDDCAARPTSGADESDEADESEEADATEDSTSTPDESGSSDSSESDDEDEPTGTPTPTGERDDPRLLPDLGLDADREQEDGSSSSTTSGDEDSTSTSESDSDSDSDSEQSGDEEGDDNGGVPVPLLPPVTLPPLLPGMPGITLG